MIQRGDATELMAWPPPRGAAAKERVSLRDLVWALKAISESQSSWICSLEPEVLLCPENAPFCSFHPWSVNSKWLDKFFQFQLYWNCFLKWSCPETLEAGETGIAREQETQCQPLGSAALMAPPPPEAHTALSLLPLILNHRTWAFVFSRPLASHTMTSLPWTSLDVGSLS